MTTDRDSAQPDFDPRFDPAFQPGYDPTVHRKQSLFARTPPVAEVFGSAGQDAPQLVSGVVARAGSAGRPAAGVSERPVAGGEFADEDETPAGDPAPWFRRVNPYFLVLGALGVILVVAGFALVNVAVDAMQNGFSRTTAEDGYAWQVFWNVSLNGAPILIGLGLASLTSIVVILAAQWRPSQRR